MPDREQKGGIARFLRRLLQRPLPSANPEQHPSIFIYDLRAEFPAMMPFARHLQARIALQAAAYKGESGAVLGVVCLSGPIPSPFQYSLIIINLRKLSHELLRERGLLHLVE